MKTRLVLLEIVNTDRLRIYRNEYYPFIQALARGNGVNTRWLSLGVEARTAATGENLYLYDPARPELDSMAAALVAARPTHVLLNEHLTPAAFSRLRGAAASARFHQLEMSPSGPILDLLEAWLGLDLSDLRTQGLLLEEAVRPDFTRIPVDDLARRIRPYPALLLGPGCDYVRSLRDHPDFTALLESEEVRTHRGCSFCVNPDPRQFISRADPVELAMEQLQGAAETLDPLLQDRSFLVRGVNLLPAIERLAAALEEKAVPPTTFFVSTRLDRISRFEDRIRRALPVLAQRSHRIHIWNMGIENHSPRENERLNKGLAPQVLQDGIRAVLGLAEDFPDVFAFDGWGYILYTPWTTLDDLRINIRELRALDPRSAGFALGTALQLMPGLPVTRLAEDAGLTVDAFEDFPTDSGCITTWDGYEVPWRFQDPRVAAMYRLTRRFRPGRVIPADDPDAHRVQAWLDSLPDGDEDLLQAAEALLDVIDDAADALPSLEEHLEAAAAMVRARTPADATDDMPSPAQARLHGALQADIDAGALELGTFRVDTLRLRPTKEGGRIELLLEGGDLDPLEVLLEEAPKSAPAFLRRGRLALSYKSRDPVPNEQEVAALCALLERAASVLDDAALPHDR